MLVVAETASTHTLPLIIQEVSTNFICLLNRSIRVSFGFVQRFFNIGTAVDLLHSEFNVLAFLLDVAEEGAGRCGIDISLVKLFDWHGQSWILFDRGSQGLDLVSFLIDCEIASAELPSCLRLRCH